MGHLAPIQKTMGQSATAPVASVKHLPCMNRSRLAYINDPQSDKESPNDRTANINCPARFACRTINPASEIVGLSFPMFLSPSVIARDYERPYESQFD